jgi:Mg-chelatase subunit ChlD
MIRDLSRTTDELARSMYGLVEHDPAVERTAHRYDDALADAAGTVREMFARLYSDAPPAERAPADAPARLSRAVHTALEDAGHFDALAGFCQWDPFAAGHAAATIGAEIPDDLLRKFADAEQPPERPPGQDEPGDAPPAPAPVDPAGERLAALRARVAVEAGVRKAVEHEEAVQGLMRALGAGDEERADHGFVRRVRAAMGNRRLRNALELVGRMKIDLRARIRSKFAAGAGTPYRVRQTSEIRSLIPAELAALADGGDRALLALQRVRNGEALGYERRRREGAKRGPFVVLLDVSGSMQGRALDEATAVAVSACLLAREQGREAHVVTFDHNARNQGSTATATATADLVERMLSVTAGGGTSVRAAFRVGLPLAGTAGDLVLISDGIADGLEPAQLAALEDARARLHYLHVGPPGSEDAGFRALATTCAVVGSLLDPAAGDSLTTALRPGS